MTSQNEESKKSVWDNFTHQYALTKTLRFELKPIGKTLDNMRGHLRYDSGLQTFLADQEIENTYQALKPIFDFLHEQFIIESLESKIAQKIDFAEYLTKYRNKKELNEKDFESTEKLLRSGFAKIYEDTAENWKGKIGQNEKGKDILTEKSFKMLTEKGILDYIKMNVDKFSEIKPVGEITKALSSFERFFTYFGGFNQNRENYYETAKEAATSVATRIVNENLPKFCDNILFFEERSAEYLNTYDFLKKLGNSLITKDAKHLDPILDNILKIEYFNQCLSQDQIEKYNEQIGNINFLINLYNQAREKEAGFRRLSLFKTLYKQIGCGKRKSLFFTLTCDKKSEADKLRSQGEEAFSVEEVLELAQVAGKKYFAGKNDNGLINTIPQFLEYIKDKEDYKGVYWSKTAINTISNKYFANWHDLKDKLEEAKVFQKASKGSEEAVKIPEAVELEGLFQELNKGEEWQVEGVVFKKSLTEEKTDLREKEKNDKRKNIILTAPTASKALLELILNDIIEHIESFFRQSDKVLKLKKYKENTGTVKLWLEDALAINQMLKYFLVKENKVKGAPLDSTIDQALKVFLGSEDAGWFQWHDALRNYLTKKPQDNVKENKLKLNFKNSTLAGGWDINKEADNYCVILLNPEGKKFLGIIAKQEKQKRFNKVFEKNEKNPLYQINNGEVWQKMEYKLLPGPNKMLPKCLIPKSERTKYGATDEILSIYDDGSFKKKREKFFS